MKTTALLISLFLLVSYICTAQEKATINFGPNDDVIGSTSYPETGMAIFTLSNDDEKARDRNVGIHFISNDLSKKWEIRIDKEEIELRKILTYTFSSYATKDYIYLFQLYSNGSFTTKLNIIKIDYEGKYIILKDVKTKFSGYYPVFVKEMSGNFYLYQIIDQKDNFYLYKLNETGIADEIKIKAPDHSPIYTFLGIANNEVYFRCFKRSWGSSPVESIDKDGNAIAQTCAVSLDGKTRYTDYTLKLDEGYATPALSYEYLAGEKGSPAHYGPVFSGAFDEEKQQFIMYGVTSDKKPTFNINVLSNTVIAGASSKKYPKVEHDGFFIANFDHTGKMVRLYQKKYNLLTTDAPAFRPNGNQHIHLSLTKTEQAYELGLDTSSKSGVAIKTAKDFSNIKITAAEKYSLPQPLNKRYTMQSESNRFIKTLPVRYVSALNKMDKKKIPGLQTYFYSEFNEGVLIAPVIEGKKQITVYKFKD